ncbi:outer membrane protein transport protein [Acidithiobacillus sp.]|uniref:OmpP1/FadL family transporter n=1 Tax=Acidithiobacillus sp. TaxID=1872118 RepID=UPI0025847CF6|nr:outer membrane protein transport protein [Acidithiobacillus sp.]MDD5374646.1 outer membrane protein transport protein [Acidithiobacillus sp.]
MKKSRILGIAVGATLAMGLSASALATDGYQLIGIGQYAMGMAGAVVAAPDDPLSAAISNPAGMAFLTPQAAFSAEMFNPIRKANLGAGEIGSHSNVYGIPAIGWVAPAFAKNWVFGGGIYGTSGMGVNYLQDMGASGYAQGFSSISFMQMAPSVAWKVNHRLAVGVTLNVAAEQVSFQQTVTQYFPTGLSAPYPTSVPVQGGLNLATPNWSYGVGATLGVLYKVNDMVTLGATYKSPMIFTPVTWQAGVQNLGSGAVGGAGQYSAHLNYPQQIALGLAIRPIPQWLISVEGQWINWHNTMNTFDIYGPWQGMSDYALPMHWSNEWVANIGTQYTVNNWLQVRAGYTHGTNPIGNKNISNNLILPAIMTNAVTVGATQKLGMGWKLTEAYMHSFAVTNTGQPGTAFLAPGNPNVSPSTTMSENSYGVQVGYDF